MNYKKIISSKELRFKILDMFSWVPDEPWLKLLYRIKNGYWMDFKNPKTFNEKLQWLKVHGFRPEYTQMVDKYGVKEYVTKKIGVEYVIPTLGVWDKPEDINWGNLPKEFVLKTTTGGGGFGVWIVKDKDTFDREQFAKEVYARHPNIGKSKQTHKNAFREHPYDGVRDRIIAEEFKKVNGEIVDLTDYKFYCFNGEPRYLLVVQGRSSGQKLFDYFDTEWKHLSVHDEGTKNAPIEPEKPSCFDKMIDISRKLSKGIPHVRVDLYLINGRPYFGEMTFYDASGFSKYIPAEYDKIFGDYLKLPISNCAKRFL